MSFGMRIWGADGALQLDETSFTMRVVYSAIVGSPPTNPAGSSFDIAVPGITPQNAAAFCVPIAPISQDVDKQLEPQVLAGVVRVWRTMRGYTSPTSGISTSSMRLIVVRFK